MKDECCVKQTWKQHLSPCSRIDVFDLWCWRNLLRVPWTSRRSKQSSLKEISPGYSIESLMLLLKLQYFGYLMRKNGLTGKDPGAGKDWGQEEKGHQKMKLLDGIIGTVEMNLSKLWETVKDRKAWHAAVHGIMKSWTWLSDWTTATNIFRALGWTGVLLMSSPWGHKASDMT